MKDYPKQVPLIIQALRLGDLGIAAIPCEVFAETGLAIKQNSPFKQTFTIELANGYNGYLPTPEQHKLGGYETWRVRSNNFTPSRLRITWRPLAGPAAAVVAAGRGSASAVFLAALFPPAPKSRTECSFWRLVLGAGPIAAG